MAGQKECGLSGCKKNLKNGARIGYNFDGKLQEVIVCEFHARMIMSGSGHYSIDKTSDGTPKLKAINTKIIT